MVARAVILAAILATTARAELLIVTSPKDGAVWTNGTAGLRVVPFREYRELGYPLPTRYPAIVDTDSGDLVERPASVAAARQQLAQRDRDQAPARVRDARAALDAIGLRVGLTNEIPARVVDRVMRTSTNAANAVLRAEAVHAYWTIRDYRLVRRLKLTDENEGD